MGTLSHAYLILAHKNPVQLGKLLSLLDRDGNDIYLHIDSKAPFSYENFNGICSSAQLHFIEPRIRVSWGGASIVKTEMAMLEEAVRKHHDYYHLLSGLDLPIKNHAEINAFFEANAGKEFLDLWQMEDHTKKRVNCYTPFPEGNHFFLTNWLNHAFKAVFRIRINAGVEWRIGSQWFSITDGFARYIVSQKEWLDKTFRHTGMCDEIFIPTLLERSPFKDNVYLSARSEGHEITMANLRYIQWTGSQSIRHPKTLDIADYDHLMEVPHLWARKFDETVDSQVIDRIVERLEK